MKTKTVRRWRKCEAEGEGTLIRDWTGQEEWEQISFSAACCNDTGGRSLKNKAQVSPADYSSTSKAPREVWPEEGCLLPELAERARSLRLLLKQNTHSHAHTINFGLNLSVCSRLLLPWMLRDSTPSSTRALAPGDMPPANWSKLLPLLKTSFKSLLLKLLLVFLRRLQLCSSHFVFIQTEPC